MGWIWILVGILSIWLWACLPARAQTQPQERILTVTGQNTVSVETAIAVIRLGVEINGSSAQQVQQQVAQRSNQLIDRLKQLPVEKLQTTGISLNPQYDYREGQARQTGVRGQNSLQFEVPIARAGQILDQAIEAGATRIESVSFRASETVLLDARKQALEGAVQDAQRQAREVLQSLNLSLRSIQRIQVNASNMVPPPVPLQQSVATFRADAPTPVMGGNQEVTANVTLDVSY